VFIEGLQKGKKGDVAQLLAGDVIVGVGAASIATLKQLILALYDCTTAPKCRLKIRRGAQDREIELHLAPQALL
jgi:S1-C subfamily serine protease